MIKNENKIVTINIISAIALQLITIVSGFVIPKIIISMFGSDVNGLISSINQFLNYISLLEGGIGSVIMAALYKPLAEHDTKKLNGVVNAANYFFKKIGLIYLVYLFVVAFVYPILVHTGYSYEYSFALIIVLGVNLIIQYFFSIQYRLLLNADRKVYYVSIVQSVIILLNLVAVVVLSRLFKDILIIKIGSALAYVIQPILFHLIVHKHYDLDSTVPKDNETLEQRWDGFFINLAAFIHENTDVVIITLFGTLAQVSVYSVYYMIILAVRSLIMSVSGAIGPSYGRIYAANDLGKINDAYDRYQFGMNLITTTIFTCTMILITPFVMVYTKGVTDAEYNQLIFGVILCLAEMIYCYRDPSNCAVYTAAKFKDVSKYAMSEAIMNIIISVILVRKYGLIGVAIGTAVSMFYRTAMNIVYLKKNVIKRKLRKAIKGLLVCLIGITAPAIICFSAMNLHCDNYLQWILKAIIVVAIVFSINGILFYISYKKEFREEILYRLFRIG